MTEKIAEVSDTAVKRATGKGWNEWIKLLGKFGASKMAHKEIAKMLEERGLIKRSKGWPAGRSFSIGWWCQMVTVGYEYAKGKRILGQTEAVGFEIGVQKILATPPEKVWRLLNSKKGQKNLDWGCRDQSKNFKKGRKNPLNMETRKLG